MRRDLGCDFGTVPSLVQGALFAPKIDHQRKGCVENMSKSSLYFKRTLVPVNRSKSWGVSFMTSSYTRDGAVRCGL